MSILNLFVLENRSGPRWAKRWTNTAYRTSKGSLRIHNICMWKTNNTYIKCYIFFFRGSHLVLVERKRAGGASAPRADEGAAIPQAERAGADHAADHLLPGVRESSRRHDGLLTIPTSQSAGRDGEQDVDAPSRREDGRWDIRDLCQGACAENRRWAVVDGAHLWAISWLLPHFYNALWRVTYSYQTLHKS